MHIWRNGAQLGQDVV